VAAALAAAGPVTAALFGDHTGTVARDGVAAFVFLFPVALLGSALRRIHADRVVLHRHRLRQ
jgi:hypothetical protein